MIPLISEGGALYTFGETEDGKLGEGDCTWDNTEPSQVNTEEVMGTVSCGGSHTIALSGVFRLIVVNCVKGRV